MHDERDKRADRDMNDEQAATAVEAEAIAEEVAPGAAGSATDADRQAGAGATAKAGDASGDEAGAKPGVEAGTQQGVEAGTQQGDEAGAKPGVETNGQAGAEADTKAGKEAATETTGDNAGPGESAGDERSEDARLAAEYYERLVRLQAEFENYRKRVQRERETDVKYAGERFVQAMLPVLDNFERALAAIPAGEETEAWRQGIVMIQRQLLEVLEKEGVTAVVADPGTEFDPHQHEAVLYEDSDEYGEGQIISELQRGYRLHDRLIRPSLVRVAR